MTEETDVTRSLRRLPYLLALERQAQRQLHRARIARQARDRPERRRRGDVLVRDPEVDGVEQIEDVPAQVRRDAAAQPDLPLDGHVEVLESGSVELIAPFVPERAGRHGLKR